MYKVYKHTTPNGKVYIGITQQSVSKRWRNGLGYAHNAYFTQAIMKYGWKNIVHEILFDDMTKEEAERKEVELIAQYKSNQREYGYNIDNGGNSVGKMSDETKQKLSDSKSGEKHPNYGKHLSDETKRKIGEAQMGVKNHRYGKKFPYQCRPKYRHYTPEQRERMRINKSLAHQGQKPVNSMSVIQYDKNGAFIAEYESCREAERITGVTFANICRCCNNERKTAGGFIWVKKDQ